MNRIKDKKLWFAVHCGKQQVKCPDTPMFGITVGLGIIGAILVSFALMALFSSFAEAAPGISLAIFVAPVAGQRHSITLKQKRTEWANKAIAMYNSAASDGKELAGDELVAYKALIKDAESLNEPIIDAEKLEAMALDPANPPNLSDPSRRPGQQVAENPATQNAKFPSEIEIISNYGRPKYFKGPDAASNAFKVGMWMFGYLFGREDCKQWCRENGLTSHWVSDKSVASGGGFLNSVLSGVRNASQEKSNTNGGFLVPTVLENIIIDLREQFGVFRGIAQVIPMASDSVMIPRRSGGLTAYAVGESVAPTESTKSWTQVGLTARKWAVLTRYTNELAEDAIINVAEDLSREIAYAFTVSEDDAGFNGDGSSTYGGIIGILNKFQNQVSAGSSTLKGALDAASGHDTFPEIDNTDLTNLMALLPKYAEPNAAWYCSQPAWNTVFSRLAAAAGGNTRETLVNGRPQNVYLGYPVIVSQKMQTTLGDLSDKPMILFGDMRLAATMGTRRGVTLAVSPDVYFTTDEIGIRGTERFDINVHDIGDTSTAGPVVALIGE